MTDSIHDDCAAEPMAVLELTALEQRIELRLQERHQLAEAFDALADRVSTALADGRSPLAQIGELDRLNHRIDQLEGEIAEEMEKAAKKIFSFSESENGSASPDFKPKALKKTEDS
ncbi:MAG: hypothetical protein H2055_04790 [Sphingopyxis sp.]|nr:hypothetical protein [Sphingopyxis sp.]